MSGRIWFQVALIFLVGAALLLVPICLVQVAASLYWRHTSTTTAPVMDQEPLIDYPITSRPTITSATVYTNPDYRPLEYDHKTKTYKRMEPRL